MSWRFSLSGDILRVFLSFRFKFGLIMKSLLLLIFSPFSNNKQNFNKFLYFQWKIIHVSWESVDFRLFQIRFFLSFCTHFFIKSTQWIQLQLWLTAKLFSQVKKITLKQMILCRKKKTSKSPSKDELKDYVRIYSSALILISTMLSFLFCLSNIQLYKYICMNENRKKSSKKFLLFVCKQEVCVREWRNDNRSIWANVIWFLSGHPKVIRIIYFCSHFVLTDWVDWFLLMENLEQPGYHGYRTANNRSGKENSRDDFHSIPFENLLKGAENC